tara:strand:- start:308 stop:1198 length:891 start_codon:yes stop_codon:yes gene_type:complete
MTEINVDLKEDREEKPLDRIELTLEEEAAFSRAKNLGQQADEVSGFKVPTDFVQLPSGGKVYPVNSHLYNVKELEIRHLTAADEDILTSRSLLRSGKAIDAVISACLSDKRINVEELLSGDKNAIVTFLRVSGYGSDYEVEMDCPSCGETTKHIFDLSNLQMKTLDIEPAAAGDNRFTFQLPQSQLNVEFRFLNSLQDKEIADAQEKMKKKTQSPIDRNVTTRLKNVIIAIEGNSDQGYINQFVDNMNVRDSRSIRKYMEDNTPDLDMSQDFECVHCGHRGEVDIPITVGFFWPEA